MKPQILKKKKKKQDLFVNNRSKCLRTHIQSKITKNCVSYVPKMHISHTKHTVLDHFNVCKKPCINKTTVDRI